MAKIINAISVESNLLNPHTWMKTGVNELTITLNMIVDVIHNHNYSD